MDDLAAHIARIAARKLGEHYGPRVPVHVEVDLYRRDLERPLPEADPVVVARLIVEIAQIVASRRSA